MQEHLADLLVRRGPLTGAQLHEELGGETLQVWKACVLSPQLALRRVGRRYLRIDRRVDGYARLSPSILREFLTYTVVGMASDPTAIERRRRDLEEQVRDISQRKLRMATRFVAEIAQSITADGTGEQLFCVALAGDVVYEMAHDVSRPERSTGRMVRGSDLDLVVIVHDAAPASLATALDDAIYRKKFEYLKNPAFREEIDYVVKPLGKLRDQASFDTFERMVACKVFAEAKLLHGNTRLFATGKTLLRENGVLDRLRAMELAAAEEREASERHLLTTDTRDLRQEDISVLYAGDEAAEFE